MKPFMIKNRVEFNETRLVDENGTYYESVSMGEAKNKSKDANLDLVCFNYPSKTELAFCKIIDYGKYLYDNKKKNKINQSNKTKTKELHLTPNIENHDLDLKLKKMKEFLDENNEVLIIMLVKGINRRHPEIAIEKLKTVKEICSEYAELVSEENFKLRYRKQKKQKP